MKTDPTKGPQHSLGFRLVALISRLQLRYQHRTSHYRELITAIHLFFAGVTALSTISIMAYLTDFMLLFPPLGPSAFILFYTPLAVAASPRNLILSHGVALLSGVGALAVAEVVFPGVGDTAAMAMNWSNVLAIGLAMGGASIAMVTLKCVHPPAAATALIAATGYLGNIVQFIGVMAAVIFLAVEAIIFNRVIGGLPYPLWRFNPNVDKMYRSLTGHTPSETTRWQKIVEQTFRRR